MDTTSIEWGDKVRKLEAQMFTDGCELTELTLGARGGVLAQYIANTLQGNGQRT
jgi:hypothetical protein